MVVVVVVVVLGPSSAGPATRIDAETATSNIVAAVARAAWLILERCQKRKDER